MSGRQRPRLSDFKKRWAGSITFRRTVIISMVVLIIMTIGSAVMLYQIRSAIRQSAETKGLAFSRSFALIGSAAVLENLFRIQEAMGQYLQPDILQLEVIDVDHMIVAAKDPTRIGTKLAGQESLTLSNTDRETLTYSNDAKGYPVLVIVEPLYDSRSSSFFQEGNIAAWLRVVFSLTLVRQEELQAIIRMLLVTVALITAGIVGVHAAQRHTSQVFRRIIGQLNITLAALGTSGKTSVPSTLDSGGQKLGQGELEYLIDVVSQTTDLVKSQSEALHESRELLQAVLDNSTAVIYIKNLEGRYILTNRQYERLFHISSQQVVGKSDHDIFPSDMAVGFQRNDRMVLEAGRPLELEEVAPHDDGFHTYISLKFPLYRPDGQPYAVGGVSTDITERKRAQEALQALTVSLEQKVKERTAELEVARDQALIATRHKSEFLASMSHELRTPLNAIIGFSEVLLEKMFGELNAKQDDYLQDILSSGRHLHALINDILDLSKVEAGRIELELQTFDLTAALENAFTLVRERARRHGIQVDLKIEQGIGAFTADERKVKQILLNLLSNAVKFTPDGGRITLSARLSRASAEISVGDTGIGIAFEDQARIFEEFFQAKGQETRKREGTGLGLALAKKFIELHGGRIWVESEVGHGSTFTFSLPTRPLVEKRTAAIETSPGVTATNPLVLVVEDDVSAAKLLSIHLNDSGFAVEVACDGESGFEKAVALRPAIITLDILMPGVDGWDLLARLNADPRTSTIPVVIVSILDERGKGVALGAAEYLVKPVDRDELLSAIRRAVRLPLQRREATVLIIDDDPMVLELMDAVLRPEGFAVIKAANGQKGLKIARERHPDLIVLDLLMANVDGFEVLDELKHDPRAAGIPVIVLTSKTLTQEDKARLNGRISALKLKGDFSRAHFVAQIRALLGQRRS